MLSWFTMRPIAYWFIGAVLCYVSVKELHNPPDEAAARAIPAPAVVALSDFKKHLHANENNRVAVTAELGFDAIYTIKQNPTGAATASGWQWIAPLRAENTTNGREITAVVYSDKREVSDADIKRWTKRSGQRGPIVTLRGALETPSSDHRAQVGEALALQNLTLTSDAIFIDPYPPAAKAKKKSKKNARDWWYAPLRYEKWRFTWLEVIGVAVILYGFLRLVLVRLI